jgi:ketosteroid isomerase-like protein
MSSCERALLQRFIDGWVSADEGAILSTLTDDCRIIESHGPAYQGKEMVRQWIADWHSRGNHIEKWVITSFHKSGDWTIFEWVFVYKSKTTGEAFEGITLAKIKDGKISYLREYRATAFPFIWSPSKQ